MSDLTLEELEELAATPASSDQLYISDAGIGKRVSFSNLLAHSLASHSSEAHSELSGIGLDDHHSEDHDHDGAPTQTLLAANTHGMPSTDTHHAQSHSLASHSSEAHSELTSIGATDHHTAAVLEGDAAGGELGGTYPNPTIDGTHSGSAHHSNATDHTEHGDNAHDGTILSGVVGSRPAAGTLDRYYWATDENILYHDTGAAWEKAAVADHADLDGVSSDQHHVESHSLASHSSEAHSELSGVGVDDHHAESHKTAHQNAGGDEINVGGLSGLLADDQHVLDAEVTAVAVARSLFDAQTVLAAVSDNTPVALAVAASRIIGRKATGNIAALTAAEVRAILGVEAGSTADQTGAEMVTLLEALTPGSQLSHDQLDDVSATDHHSNADDHANTLDHAQSHTGDSHSDIASTGAAIDAAVSASHAESHSLASHSSEAHSELSSVGVDDHHDQAHGLSDHAAELAFVKKASDETVNNNTLQNDDDLVFAVGANEVWEITLLLMIRSDPTPTFKWKFIGPAGSTLFAFMSFTQFNFGTQQMGDLLGIGTEWTLTAVPTSGAAQTDMMLIRGIIVTAGNAGNIQLQWAQGTTDGADTKVLAGSYISARKVA